MATKDRTSGRQFRTVTVGLLAATVVLIASLAGVMRWAELRALDVRLVHAAPGHDTGQILYVDIDPRSIRQLGRFPWPREILADVLQTLDEAGARLVVVDLLLATGEEPRYELERNHLYDAWAANALTDETTTYIGVETPLPIHDDRILAHALRETRNALLGVTVNFDAAGRGPAPAADPNISWRLWQAGLPEGTPPDALVYLRARSLAKLESFAIPVDDETRSRLPYGPAGPPLPPFLDAAAGIGTVVYRPDSDRITRRLPLLAGTQSGVLAQLSLEAASRISPSGEMLRGTITTTTGEITITYPDDSSRHITTTPSGDMILRWTPGSWPNPDEKLHISVGPIAQVGQIRRDIARNRRVARATLIQMARDRAPRLEALFTRADDLYLRRMDAERRRYAAMLYDPSNVPPEPTELRQSEADTEAQIDRLAKEFLQEVDEFYLATVPEQPAARAAYDAMKAQRDMLANQAEVQGKLEEKLAQARAAIAPRVAGKIVLLGVVTEDIPDFIPTPLDARTPGVVVHGNALQTILNGNAIAQAPTWINALVLLALGAYATIVAAWRPLVHAAGLTLLGMIAYTCLNAWVLLGQFSWWVNLAAPLAAMFMAFLAVSVYRQLTEERARRRIRGMFAHALSRQLVDQLLADPSIAQLGGQTREVTCMFSDLQGFTDLSQRIGPTRTVVLLNRYFDCVTDTVQGRWGGYINKFLGDGVFALFGAPVRMDDHARRAVASSLDYVRAVEDLNAVLSDLQEGSLTVRIGLTTDRVMVGNCGSTDRMDYTAIGDAVNLASRLESANKVFGTRILIASPTWQACDPAEILARPLGKVVIAGVAEPVRVWNVLARRTDADADQIDAAGSFASAIEALWGGDIAAAADRFASLAEADPSDTPTTMYLWLCRQALATDDPLGFRPPDINRANVLRIAWPTADVAR